MYNFLLIKDSRQIMIIRLLTTLLLFLLFTSIYTGLVMKIDQEIQNSYQTIEISGLTA